MPAKLEHCVKKVKKKEGVDSAYAICTAAMNKTKKPTKPFKRLKGKK